MFNIFPLLCIFQLIDSHLDSLPDEIAARDSLAKCIAKAGELYFKDHEVITVSLAPLPENDTQTPTFLESLLLSELYRKHKWLVLVKNPKTSLVLSGSSALYDYKKKSDSYIIQIRTLEGLNDQLGFLRRLNSWNPHAKFKIISMTYFEDTNHDVIYIIQKLWDLDILNGVVLFRDGKTSKTFNIYTWFPYISGRCGDKFHKIENIGSCIDGNIYNKQDWFEEKIPNNLNLCPISVRTIVYPPFVLKPEAKVDNTKDEYIFENGLEIKLLNLVARVANLSIKYSTSGKVDDWGSVQLNGSLPTGIIGLLYEGDFDLGVGSMSANVERFLMLDYSIPYFQDSLIFCVPHAEEISQWKKLSDIIATSIYIAIAVLFILNVVVIFFVSRNERRKYGVEHKAYSNCSNVSFKLFAITLGNTINLLPKTLIARMFIMCWIILTLHINIAYQTYLMSSLTRPVYEKQINTMGDILNKHLDFLFLESSRKYFEAPSKKYSSWETNDIILNNWKLCQNLDQCLYRTAHKRDSVTGISRLYANFVKNKYKSTENLPLLYCFSQNIVSYPIVMYMRKGFPLGNRINSIIDRINAAGFLKKWQDNLFSSNIFIPDNIELERKYLSLNHLTPVFIVLIVGIIISTFIFACEIIYYRHNIMKKRSIKKFIK